MTEMTRLKGRLQELAEGLSVRRVLPAAIKRAVGPFVFFDHMGPARLTPGIDSDVGGHPHIGLATVTYLFEGCQVHRDSLGSVQLITPGDVNWMTAGQGIVHSERTPEEDRGRERTLHGLQLWVALPPALEQIDPSFQHVTAADIPQVAEQQGAVIRILVGEAWGRRSPVNTVSPTLYLDVQLAPDLTWELPALAAEMALYSPMLPLQVSGQDVAPQEMVVLPGGTVTRIQSGPQGARLVVIGGAPLEQPVYMWWNYVSVDRQRIKEAAKRWEKGGFKTIPGDAQRINGPVYRPLD